jgi:hypothetical protein
MSGKRTSTQRGSHRRGKDGKIQITQTSKKPTFLANLAHKAIDKVQGK